MGYFNSFWTCFQVFYWKQFTKFACVHKEFWPTQICTDWKMLSMSSCNGKSGHNFHLPVVQWGVANLFVSLLMNEKVMSLTSLLVQAVSGLYSIYILPDCAAAFIPKGHNMLLKKLGSLEVFVCFFRHIMYVITHRLSCFYLWMDLAWEPPNPAHGAGGLCHAQRLSWAGLGLSSF